MRLVKWGFFDKDLFDSAGILTSRGIQKRYFDATKKRTFANDDLPYLLGFRGENPRLGVVSAEKTPENKAFSPKKVHKVKESKDNIKLSNSLPSRTREEELLERFDRFTHEIIDGDYQIWRDQIKNKYHISGLPEAMLKFRQYAVEMALLEKIKGIEDYQRYFIWKSGEFLKDKNNESNNHNSKTCRFGPGVAKGQPVVPRFGLKRD